MTVFIALLYMLTFGYLLLNLADQQALSLNPLFKICLSFSLGCMSLTFCTFFYYLLFSQYNQAHLLSIYIFLFVFVMFLHVLLQRKPLSLPRFSQRSFPANFIMILPGAVLWLGLTALIIKTALHHPYGQWDAWALWNTKFRFLLYHSDWRVIFSELHPYTQPDYPLMLPFFNIVLNVFAPAHTSLLPMLTSILFTALTPLLLMSGLAHFIRRDMAVLTAFILMLNPYYQFLGTAQYADILLSYFLLMTFILICCLQKKPGSPLFFLTGCHIGLLSFIKNEGLLLMPLLSIWVMTVFFQTPFKKRHGWLTAAGLFISFLPTFILKIFLTAENTDIFHPVSIMNTPYLNQDTFIQIMLYMFHELTHPRWAFIWIFVLLLSILRCPAFFKKKILPITLFFISFTAGLLVIYLTTSQMNLTWRLESTLSRILFYLLPTVLFSLSFLHWQKESAS